MRATSNFSVINKQFLHGSIPYEIRLENKSNNEKESLSRDIRGHKLWGKIDSTELVQTNH